MRVSILGLALMGTAMVAGCKRVAPPTPIADLNEQQARGHAVFQTHCGVCHYDRRDGALHGPSLAGLYKKTYLPSGAPANDDRVTETIKYGRTMMPPMGNTMDAQELDDLVAYLHTL